MITTRFRFGGAACQEGLTTQFVLGQQFGLRSPLTLLGVDDDTTVTRGGDHDWHWEANAARDHRMTLNHPGDQIKCGWVNRLGQGEYSLGVDSLRLCSKEYIISNQLGYPPGGPGEGSIEDDREIAPSKRCPGRSCFASKRACHPKQGG